MPNFKVRNVKGNGATRITAEGLTVKEHGGEEWQTVSGGEFTKSAFGNALRKVSRQGQPSSEASSETSE